MNRAVLVAVLLGVAAAAAAPVGLLAGMGYSRPQLRSATLRAQRASACFSGVCSGDPGAVRTAADCPYATSLCSAVDTSATSRNPWIQIDLGARRNIVAVAAYGGNKADNRAVVGRFTVVVADDPHFLHTTECAGVTDADKTGPQIARCHGSSGVQGRYVRLVLLGEARALRVAKLEAFVKGGVQTPVKQLYSRVKAVGATMSSTFNDQCTAANCIDGKTQSKVSGCKVGASICHSKKNTKDPWLQIDLGSVKHVVAAVVYNRIDCRNCQALLGHHEILVSHDATFANGAKVCHRGTAADAPGPFVEPCSNGAQGRYVRLVLPGAARTLNIREFEIFARPLPPKPSTCVDDPTYRCAHYAYGPKGKCVAGLAHITTKCCAHCWDYVSHEAHLKAQPLVLPGCACNPATHPESSTTSCAESEGTQRMHVTHSNAPGVTFAERRAHYHKCALLNSHGKRLVDWTLHKLGLGGKGTCKCCDCTNPFYSHRKWRAAPIAVESTASSAFIEPAFVPTAQAPLAAKKGVAAQKIERPVSGAV